MKAPLVLVRHGTSEWNKLGLWTGWTDVGLDPDGIAQAQRIGELLRDLSFERAYVSDMKRAQETLRHLLEAYGSPIETVTHPALKERNYGIHTGKNKWQVREQVGEEEFQKIRRSWDHPIHEGESLKEVHARVVPYFETTIRPDLEAGKGVLLVAHGNSLRALIKHLEAVEDDAISTVEFGHDEAHYYEANERGIIKKEIRNAVAV